MPRTAGTQPSPRAPHPVSQALTAAAVSYPGLVRNVGPSRAPVQKLSWQREVWEMFEVVGEFAFSAMWISNVCSRARLVVKKRDSDGVLQPVKANHPAVKALNELTGGSAGQGEFIRMASLHLGVAADVYFVNRRMRPEDAPMRDDIGADESIWEVVGTEEISGGGDAPWVLTYEGGRTIVLEKDDVVIRAYMPHPRNRSLAYSLSKSALPILREIRGYDLHIEAQQDSRLTGNGMLLFPAEMTMKPPQGYSADLSAADVVSATLVKAVGDSKEFRGTAEAQVPVIFTPPAEFLDKIRHLKFWTEFDDKVVQGRKDALVRLATTVDIPKEVVTGTGDMNRWGAWQVEESSIKVHIEPKMDMLADIITREYLVPALGDDSLVVTVDTAVLRLRPNRSKEALELNDRGLLNAAATLRETGFDPDTDLMQGDEYTQWLLRKQVVGSWSPEMIYAALKMVGIDLQMPQPTDDTLREPRPDPSLLDHPTQDAPEKSVVEGTQDDVGLAASAGQSATCAAMLAYRAIERAGNRLKTVSRVKPPEGTLASEVHLGLKVFPDRIEALIEHAWSGVETFGASQEEVDRAKNYTRFLLSESLPFDLNEAVGYVREGRL